MKITSFFIGLLFVIFSSIPHDVDAQSVNLSKKKIIGQWQIIALSGEQVPAGVDMRISFSKDGAMKMTANGEALNEAQWKVSDNKKAITVTTGEFGEEDWEIKAFSKKEMTIVDNEEELLLQKVAKTKKTKKTKKKKLKGVAKKISGPWKVISLNDKTLPEEASVVLNINSDGSIEMNRNGTVEDSGTWKLSEDNKSLIVINDNDKEESWEIIELSKKKLTFLDGEMTIKLDRK